MIMIMNYSTDNESILNAVASRYQATPYTYYQVSPTWKFDSDKKFTDKINYVIATWSGPRRQGNDEYHENSVIYIDKHLKSLSTLKHNLAQITLVIPFNPEESKEFRDFIKQLPTHINQTPLKLLKRGNLGQSYGSYSDAFMTYRRLFNYFIFIEDDYVFAQDNFDQVMVQMFNSCENCGFLCSFVSTALRGELPHGAISNGISNTEILNSIVKKYGELPYGEDSTVEDSAYTATPQLEFTRSFIEVKKRLYDYLTVYNAPFNDGGKYKIYGSEKDKSLIVPIQYANY